MEAYKAQSAPWRKYITGYTVSEKIFNSPETIDWHMLGTPVLIKAGGSEAPT